MQVTVKETTLYLDEQTLHISVKSGGELWSWTNEYRPVMRCKEGELFFQAARRIGHEAFSNGIGQGIRSHYEGFAAEAGEVPYSFETAVWIEEATEDVYFEWIPLNEEGLHPLEVLWPGPMEFEEKDKSWYTLINEQQGLLIPNTWETALRPLSFNGFFGTAGGYMPWFAQVRGQAGYIAICQTPWNAGYKAEHPAGGPYTHVSLRLEPSLGKMEYRRSLRLSFRSCCDYNDLCKIYRSYVKERGKLCTLKQKAAKNPEVDSLIGCAFIHLGIKTMVQPSSDFFDETTPEKNNHLTPFCEREQEIRRLYELGVKKVYLHLDGWAEPGYDNRHPDYFPACEAAGGWEGMKALADTLHECGYLFGIHDQYRDYYLTAPSYDENYACLLPDATIPKHSRWAGGPQSYLCATQAPYYVKRNFKKLHDHGISLDCAYLDVFTCNEGDECANPQHRMTRQECYGYRNQCFEYLLANGILPSSEEVSDWSVESLVFCHYAPYDFMLKKPGEPKQGIPVPLYNLVYHDCLIIPWMMDKVNEQEDYMLYALLNGGAPYLIRDGAYPNFDGSFEGGMEQKLEEDIARCGIVSELHQRVAKCEMIKHIMEDGDPKVQKTIFSDGTEVRIDLRKQTFTIKQP